MSTPDQSAREQKRAWERLGSIERDPIVQGWLREMDQKGPDPRRFGRGRLLALAAGVLLAFGAVAAAYFQFTSPRYETQVGEQRDVLLPDGSRVTLNTNTSLTVRYSKTRRYIELRRGEALFSVQRNTRWPFDVAAGGTLTRALGTQFNVDLRSNTVTVSVLEGAVQVEARGQVAAGAVGSAVTPSSDGPGGMATIAPALAKGEAVEVRPHEHRVVAEKADLHRIDAWRTRRLEFGDTPLPEAVEEFNRYSNTRVVVGSPELQSVRVSGVFQIGDTEGFLFSLKEALRVQTLESPGEVTLVRSKS